MLVVQGTKIRLDIRHRSAHQNSTYPSKAALEAGPATAPPQMAFGGTRHGTILDQHDEILAALAPAVSSRILSGVRLAEQGCWIVLVQFTMNNVTSC